MKYRRYLTRTCWTNAIKDVIISITSSLACELYAIPSTQDNVNLEMEGGKGNVNVSVNEGGSSV